MKTIAERIREGMEIRNIKQVDIVEKTGINKGALSSYISGKYEPKQNNIFLIAKALDVNEAWLMGHDVPMERLEAKHVTDEFTAKNPNERKVLLLARKTENLPPEKREKVINFFEETIDTYLEAMGDIFGKNKDGE